MTADVIDPAFEMAGAIRQLLTQGPSNEPTLRIIRKAIGNINASELWDLLAVMNDRAVQLHEFVSTLEDPEFTEEQRGRLKQATSRLVSLFDPEQQQQTWQHTRQHYVMADDALELSWFSLIAKRYQALRKLNDVERKEIITKIDEVLKILPKATDIPPWAKGALADGLRRLRTVLDHLLFFGCATGIEQLMRVYHQALDVEDELGREGASFEGGRCQTILQVLTIVALAVNILCSPDQATTAFERYKGWALRLLSESPRLPQPRLLLAGPARTNRDNQPHTPTAPSQVAEPETRTDEQRERRSAHE